MEDNNLKECWKEIHTGTEIFPSKYLLIKLVFISL